MGRLDSGLGCPGSGDATKNRGEAISFEETEEPPSNKGAAQPVTPPKAPPAKPQNTQKENPVVGATPKMHPSPPPRRKEAVAGEVTLSTPSESSKASRSPGGKSEEKGADRKKSRSPLQRRPFGTKQREKAAKGEFGKVKFADPIDDRDKSEEKKKDGGKEEGRLRDWKRFQQRQAQRKRKAEGQAEGKTQRKDKTERESKRRRKTEGGEESCPSWGSWRQTLRLQGEGALHTLGITRKILRNLVKAPSRLGESLRHLLVSPPGERDVRGGGTSPFPLPLTVPCVEALRHFACCRSKTKPSKLVSLSDGEPVMQGTNYNEIKLAQLAWCGMLVLALNSSRGFTHTASTMEVRDPLKKRVLDCLFRDAVSFVEGDGLSNEVVRRPEVPWSRRISDLTVTYGGDVVEKARWLTLKQIEPGLPPVGKGGLLFAPDFCEGWVARHLLDAEQSRLRDELIPDPLPFAVVRCTQTEWGKIALELINRGVATVMEPEHIATCRGEPILNGAFGVVKPNKWVGSPADNCPVLRLIMDFRAANAAHRMLPGSVSSLVGAAKWQGFCLDKKEILVTSGDDLVAAFYLFRLPFSWSRYFTFRKPTTRGALHLDGDPQAKVFIASQVLPMGWAAAVTIMQHMHRRVALWGGGLPQEREIHRERALPEKLTSEVSSYWNLYVDDLSVMEIVAEDWAASQSQEKPDLPELQRKMQQAYLELGVPFSKEKSTLREVACEKLGALIHGKRGVLGVTTARALDFVTLALYMMSCEKVPTRWFQIFLGKFVHIVQFRRPMFSMVQASWRRLQSFHGAGPMTSEEIDEWFRLCMALPLAYTDLRARVAHRVTCSDGDLPPWVS